MIKKDITPENPFKICFVCLGNICRSPTAEGVMQHLVNERSLQSYFEIDSAGTSSYHTGESANVHSQRVANQHGITLHSKARRFETFDLDYFDLILTMDRKNLSNVRRLDDNNQYAEKIMMLRDFDPVSGDKDVPDPYSGGLQGFEKVFKVVKRCCENLLDELEQYIED
ncbi:MAG TPA: low molecular weight protein-tyrosine-phosphatase [Balneolaceae bacterium]|nr:low molecular weight protein-tyrosine-phosphatase [Balneolaceae bacterium]